MLAIIEHISCNGQLLTFGGEQTLSEVNGSETLNVPAGVASSATKRP